MATDREAAEQVLRRREVGFERYPGGDGKGLFICYRRNTGLLWDEVRLPYESDDNWASVYLHTRLETLSSLLNPITEDDVMKAVHDVLYEHGWELHEPHRTHGRCYNNNQLLFARLVVQRLRQTKEAKP